MNAGMSVSSTYYNEVSRAPMIEDPDEERRLVKRWQAHKDLQARNAVVQSHLRFVVRQARKKCPRDPTAAEDYIAAGNLGLLRAIEPGRFDPDRNPYVRFLTYASAWIYKEIMEQDYTSSSVVHVPPWRQKEQRKKAHTHAHAQRVYGVESPEAARTAYARHDGTVIPLEAMDELGDAESLSTDYHRRQVQHLLDETLSKLPLREALILRLHFGMRDEPRNLMQISKIMDMTPERVRQIKVHALELMKGRLQATDLEALDLAC